MNRESLAKIDQLCHWIEANCAQAINWEDLIVQSELNVSAHPAASLLRSAP